MKERTEIVRTALPNGAVLHVQANVWGESAEHISFILPSVPDFKNVTDTIEGLAESLTATLQKVKPHKATVEFGLDVGVEAGQLTALLVKGTGAAHLKVTLEWDSASY